MDKNLVICLCMTCDKHSVAGSKKTHKLSLNTKVKLDITVITKKFNVKKTSL